jgi:hypothetical protein
MCLESIQLLGNSQGRRETVTAGIPLRLFVLWFSIHPGEKDLGSGRNGSWMKLLRKI